VITPLKRWRMGGTRSQGISQFFLHNRVHPLTECLCLPRRSWYSFSDPGGMEGWGPYNKALYTFICLLTYLLTRFAPFATPIIMMVDIIIDELSVTFWSGWLITRLINYTPVPSLLSTGYPLLHVFVTGERRLTEFPAITSTINGPSTLAFTDICYNTIAWYALSCLLYTANACCGDMFVLKVISDF